MGKTIFLILSLFIVGCEQTYDNLIDTTNSNYQVISVGPTGDFTYSVNDSLITISITFSASSEVNNVYCDIIASDDTKLNGSPFQLFETDSKLFQNDFPLSSHNTNGTYNLNYFVKDSDGMLQRVARGSFNYNNGQNNVTPVISDLVCPNSINRGVDFIFSVTANDPNGLNDIESVSFKLFRPDGTIVEESPGDTLFAMHDDGDLGTFGDSTAGDGVYSFKNSFALTAQTGNWKFIFQAEDRGGSLSNIIEHFISVQ